MSKVTSGIAHDRLKWAFFALMAGCTLLVILVDERFIVDFQDPNWQHIVRYKWWLLVHGVPAATALIVGPFQFSDTLRRTRLNLHRWTGRIYIGAVAIAAPVGGYIGTSFLKPILAAEQPAQSGLWFATTAMALICVLNRNIGAHRVWMMKSYCFCLLFVVSRVPDAVPVKWSDAGIATFLWYLIIAALVGPDVVLAVRELWRRRTPAISLTR